MGNFKNFTNTDLQQKKINIDEIYLLLFYTFISKNSF
jgi:hypothetical protein